MQDFDPAEGPVAGFLGLISTRSFFCVLLPTGNWVFKTQVGRNVRAKGSANHQCHGAGRHVRVEQAAAGVVVGRVELARLAGHPIAPNQTALPLLPLAPTLLLRPTERRMEKVPKYSERKCVKDTHESEDTHRRTPLTSRSDTDRRRGV